MPKKTSENIQASDVLASLERLARLNRAASHRHGLNPVQWDALRYLARANRFSNAPIALTHYLAVTKGTISQTISSLVRKGLIIKTARDSDSRSIVLNLTEQGQTLLADDPIHHVEKAMTELSEKTKRRLARGISEILESERQRQNKPSFGSCKTCKYLLESGSDYRCALFKQDLSKKELQLICVEHAN